MFKEINGSHYNLDSVFDVVASNGKYYAFLVNGTRLEISVTDYNMLISSLVKVGDHYINRKHILKVSPNNGNYTLQFTNGSQIGLSFDDYASLISEYDIDAFEWKTKISGNVWSSTSTSTYNFTEAESFNNVFYAYMQSVSVTSDGKLSIVVRTSDSSTTRYITVTKVEQYY